MDSSAHRDIRPAAAPQSRMTRLAGGVAGALGGAAVLAAVTLGALLALVFAATLAVVVLLAGMLIALAALAWRVRPKAERSAAAARRGHGWITYSWDVSGL